ncbi:hypothetical protein WICPIJ_008795 [Wickerhamomyces pijperi]|uniref:Uncharacterized protein n=1 Tax=Wickerhamomyces pijperi TaxID=599730 RepID=A0A9P8PVG9_WICPI|nr:hypothetical protein WICPIJ_008795 [Wickerhamomyces pijperi]
MAVIVCTVASSSTTPSGLSPSSSSSSSSSDSSSESASASNSGSPSVVSASCSSSELLSSPLSSTGSSSSSSSSSMSDSSMVFLEKANLPSMFTSSTPATYLSKSKSTGKMTRALFFLTLYVCGSNTDLLMWIESKGGGLEIKICFDLDVFVVMFFVESFLNTSSSMVGLASSNSTCWILLSNISMSFSFAPSSFIFAISARWNSTTEFSPQRLQSTPSMISGLIHSLSKSLNLKAE